MATFSSSHHEQSTPNAAQSSSAFATIGSPSCGSTLSLRSPPSSRPPLSYVVIPPTGALFNSTVVSSMPPSFWLQPRTFNCTPSPPTLAATRSRKRKNAPDTPPRTIPRGAEQGCTPPINHRIYSSPRVTASALNLQNLTLQSPSTTQDHAATTDSPLSLRTDERTSFQPISPRRRYSPIHCAEASPASSTARLAPLAVLPQDPRTPSSAAGGSPEGKAAIQWQSLSMTSSLTGTRPSPSVYSTPLPKITLTPRSTTRTDAHPSSSSSFRVAQRNTESTTPQVIATRSLFQSSSSPPPPPYEDDDWGSFFGESDDDDDEDDDNFLLAFPQAIVEEKKTRCEQFKQRKLASECSLRGMALLDSSNSLVRLDDNWPPLNGLLAVDGRDLVTPPVQATPSSPPSPRRRE